jgi:hypothetical protein
MEANLEVAVAVIKQLMKTIKFIFLFVFAASLQAQEDDNVYKKKVLDQTEVKLLTSYYSQDGDNASVSGGLGSEELTDIASAIVVSIPLNEDDVLTIDANVSAYTSASSSNIDPFDGNQPADPFVASSGASRQDVWTNANVSYTHSSDDRNFIWAGNVSFANEYDYSSIGFGGSLTKLFNEKNTEIGLKANIYLDQWSPQYPIELRNGIGKSSLAKDDSKDFNLDNYTIVGNQTYNTSFSNFETLNRNSYSLGFNVSQILSQRLQTVFLADVVYQEGLLSTPHQRIYFGDIEDSFIENFQLANDVERLPDTRTKIAIGNRSSFYINENFIIRSYYRYYTDDWGINSHTAKLEVPIKIGTNFTFYPMYRFYTQTKADDFYLYNEALSTSEFYTSDYDLAAYDAHQYGLGFKYYDPLGQFNLSYLRLKSIDFEFNAYERTNLNFTANIFSLGFNFTLDK